MARAYSLLEHEDTNDEGEGDQVGDDPHEAVLVWGLWTDGRGSSSHGPSTPGSRLRARGREDPCHHGGGAGEGLEAWGLVIVAGVGATARGSTGQEAGVVLRAAAVCAEPVR